MKKVLVISSSPRKGGNSDLMCEAFARGAREAGHSVEYVSLAGKNIGFCRGCYACKNNGNRCVIKDDAPSVVEKMLEAEVLVFGTPVYFYSVCARLKAVFDRTVCVYPDLGAKEYCYLISLGDPDPAGAEGVLNDMAGFLKCYPGTVLGKVVAPGLYDLGAVKDTPFLEESYKLGRSLE